MITETVAFDDAEVAEEVQLDETEAAQQALLDEAYYGGNDTVQLERVGRVAEEDISVTPPRSEAQQPANRPGASIPAPGNKLPIEQAPEQTESVPSPAASDGETEPAPETPERPKIDTALPAPDETPELAGDNDGDGASPPPDPPLDSSSDNEKGKDPREIYAVTASALCETKAYRDDETFADLKVFTKVDGNNVKISSYQSSVAKDHPETSSSEQAHREMLRNGTGIVTIAITCQPGETDKHGNPVREYHYDVATPNQAFRPTYHMGELSALAGVSANEYDEVVADIYQYTDGKPTVEDVHVGFTQTAKDIALDEPVVIAATFYHGKHPHDEEYLQVVGEGPEDAKHHERLGKVIAQLETEAKETARNKAHTEAYLDAHEAWLDEELTKLANTYSRVKIEPEDLKQTGRLAILEAMREAPAASDNPSFMEQQLLHAASQKIRDHLVAETRRGDFYSSIETSINAVQKINEERDRQGKARLSITEIAEITGLVESSDTPVTLSAADIHQYYALGAGRESWDAIREAQAATETAYEGVAPNPNFTSLHNVTGPTEATEMPDYKGEFNAIMRHYLHKGLPPEIVADRLQRLRILVAYRLGLASMEEIAEIEDMDIHVVRKTDRVAIRQMREARSAAARQEDLKKRRV